MIGLGWPVSGSPTPLLRSRPSARQDGQAEEAVAWRLEVGLPGEMQRNVYGALEVVRLDAQVLDALRNRRLS